MAASFRTLLSSISGAAALASAVLFAPAPPAAAADAPPSQLADTLIRVLAQPRDEVPVNRFIGAGRLPAADVVRRSRGLLKALRDRRDRVAPEAYLDAVRRIAGLASRALATTPVIGLAVIGSRRPQNAAAALDFGSPGRPVMPGFERVAPGDSRIEGQVESLRSGNVGPLLSEGLSGISKIKLPLGPGEYRIILISGKSGGGKAGRFPFGRELRVNGVPVRIDGAGDGRWHYDALLLGGDAASGDADSLPEDGAQLFARQQAGALVLEAKTEVNELVVEFTGLDGAPTYLTGLLVERLDGPSNILLSRSAREAIVPLRQRLELEADLLEEAARAVEGIAPALGQTPRGDDVASRDS